MDTDGENQAVRAFLLLYSTILGRPVKEMTQHMRRSGFDCVPAWAIESPGANLTKAGMATTPDLWSLYKIEYHVGTEKAETAYRVLASWSGSYLYGAAGKLSSKIQSVELREGGFLFHNSSGSTYDCTDGSYGMTGYSAGVMGSISEKQPEHKLTLIPEAEVLSTLKAAGIEVKE
jgi:hypothetical protein